MAISDEHKYLLDNRAGKIFNKVKLGTLIRDAEQGGLGAGSVELSNLDAGIAPSHVVKFAGEHTTAGGAAAEAITVTGLLATDLVFITLVDPGSNTVSIDQAVPTTDTLTVTFSGDPGNDAVVHYMAIRATA